MPSPAIRQNQPTAARSNARANHAPTTARTTPASPEDARDSAISDISAARAQPRRVRTPSWTRAADRVARAYEENHSAADVHQLLRQNPDIMRAVATGPAGAIEERMQDVAGWLDGSSALGAVEDFVNGAVRDAVATHAQRTIQGSIRETEARRTDILSNFDRYRNAPADSPEGQVMAALHLKGTSTEADVNHACDTTVHGLEALSSRFEGQAWEPGDFPNSVRVASGRLRLRAHTGEETLADRVVEARSGTAEGIASGVADFAHAGVDGYLALSGEHVVAGILTVELGVLAAGLALGLVIHHGAEEVRNHAIDLAHSLGI